MQTISSKEFVCWQRYFRMRAKARMKRHSKIEHYFAQLTATIVRMKAQDPKRIRNKDFLLEWEFPEDRKQPTQESQTTRESKLIASKTKWAMLCGTTLKKLKQGQKNVSSSSTPAVDSSSNDERRVVPEHAGPSEPVSGKTRKRPSRPRDWKSFNRKNHPPTDDHGRGGGSRVR